MLTRIASFLFVANTATLAIAMATSTLSTKMSRVKAPYNKYAKLLSERSYTSSSSYTNTLKAWSEYLFGQERVNDGFERAKSRLGQTNSAASKELQTSDGSMWTGELYLGSQG